MMEIYRTFGFLGVETLFWKTLTRDLSYYVHIIIIIYFTEFQKDINPYKLNVRICHVTTITRAQLEDVGQNADLHIANQGANSHP